MRSKSLCTLLIGALLVVGAGCADPAPEGPATIVLVTLDGLDPARVGTTGGAIPTPTLDGLVADGRLYRDAWSTTPLSRAAVATYLTGTLPPVHGVRDDISTALDPSLPTLATTLDAAGFATAAFPDSSVLGFDSGVLRGFQVVDDPPVARVGPITWIPVFGFAKPVAKNVEAWLTATPGDAFVWVHLSHGTYGQLLPDDQEIPTTAKRRSVDRPDLSNADATLGAVLDVLRTGGRYDGAWIVVAATFGDAVGGDGGLPGLGMSLSPAAVRVPLIIKPPRGVSPPADGPIWAPDVATTLAGAAGVSIDGSVGVDLTAGSPPADRVRLSWSGVPRDQHGWRPLVSATLGGAVLTNGEAASPTRRLAEGVDDPGDGVWRTLRSAIATAGFPAAPSVPLDEVRAALESYGVTPDPVPASGRSFDDPEQRASVARDSLAARVALMTGDRSEGLQAYDRVLEIDPLNLGAGVGRGQLPALRGDSETAQGFMRTALGRYPDNPDALHWFAHAIWGQSVTDAEVLLRAVEPFKPQEGDVLYDLACARSLAGDLPESEALLRRAIESGFRPWQLMDADPDLRNLRESGRFAAIMREYRR